MKTAIFIPVALILVFFAPLSSAEVMTLNVSPQVVDSGDVITISGKASSGEVVWLGSSFELPLPVSDGRYYRKFDDINFPDGEKKFSVTAENIKNLDVTLYPMHFYTTIKINCSGQTMTFTALGQTITTPLSESIDETNMASFSMSFPIEKFGITLNIDGKKDVTVSGDAVDGASTVDLKLATSLKLTAGPTPTPTPANDAYAILRASVGLTNVDIDITDIDGDGSITANDAYIELRRASGGIFSFDMNTNGIPDGEFLITAGGKTETVYIGVEPSIS